MEEGGGGEEEGGQEGVAFEEGWVRSLTRPSLPSPPVSSFSTLTLTHVIPVLACALANPLLVLSPQPTRNPSSSAPNSTCYKRTRSRSGRRWRRSEGRRRIRIRSCCLIRGSVSGEGEAEHVTTNELAVLIPCTRVRECERQRENE